MKRSVFEHEQCDQSMHWLVVSSNMKRVVCCFRLSLIRSWHNNSELQSVSRWRFKIAKNNFDSRSSLMISPFPIWKPVGGENSHRSYSCQSLRSVAAAKCWGSRFNNTADCLPALIYPGHGSPQSNLEQIGVTELLQRLENDPGSGRSSFMLAHS